MLKIEEAVPDYPKATNVFLKKCDFVSVRSLLNWINDSLGLELKALEELRSGAYYCQLLHRLFPKCVPLHKVDFRNGDMRTCVGNYEILLKCFYLLNITKDIPVYDLKVGRGLLDFTKWFHKFYKENKNDLEYNAKERRDWAQVKRVSSTLSLNLSSGRKVNALRSHSIVGSTGIPRLNDLRSASLMFLEKSNESALASPRSTYKQKPKRSENIAQVNSNRKALLDQEENLSDDTNEFTKLKARDKAKTQSIPVVGKEISKSIIRNDTHTVIPLTKDWAAVGNSAKDYEARSNVEMESASKLPETSHEISPKTLPETSHKTSPEISPEISPEMCDNNKMPNPNGNVAAVQNDNLPEQQKEIYLGAHNNKPVNDGYYDMIVNDKSSMSYNSLKLELEFILTKLEPLLMRSGYIIYVLRNKLYEN